VPPGELVPLGLDGWFPSGMAGWFPRAGQQPSTRAGRAQAAARAGDLQPCPAEAESQSARVGSSKAGTSMGAATSLIL